MTPATGILNDRGVDQSEVHGPALLGSGGKAARFWPPGPWKVRHTEGCLERSFDVAAPPKVLESAPTQGPQSRPSCASLC